MTSDAMHVFHLFAIISGAIVGIMLRRRKNSIIRKRMDNT